MRGSERGGKRACERASPSPDASAVARADDSSGQKVFFSDEGNAQKLGMRDNKKFSRADNAIDQVAQEYKEQLTNRLTESQVTHPHAREGGAHIRTQRRTCPHARGSPPHAKGARPHTRGSVRM